MTHTLKISKTVLEEEDIGDTYNKSLKMNKIAIYAKVATCDVITFVNINIIKYPMFGAYSVNCKI